MSEFQPPDREEEPEDDKWERWFAEKEKGGYAVISRDEWHSRLDDAATDGYAEGRKDEREQLLSDFATLLPGSYYMAPPDGGGASVMEQLQRMSEDARQWREQQERIRLAIKCELSCEGG